MENTIVLYVEAEHLDTVGILAIFIAKHHPSLPIILLSSAAEPAALSAAAVPSVTYRRLPSPTLPPHLKEITEELFFELPRLNNLNLRHALQEISQKARITAFVIDFFSNSAFEVSTSLNIPTYFYFSAGSPSALQILYLENMHDAMTVDIGDLNDFVETPGLAPIFSLDIPKCLHSRHNNVVYKHMLDVSKNLRRSAGVIVNGFDALEFRAKEAISNGLVVPNGPTPPHFFIGPLISDIIGTETGGQEHGCLKWLDTQPRKSVIFLSFGRRGVFSAQQLKEIAVALENSGHRFLWSVRNPPEMENSMPDLDELLPEGFLERTKGRGFVIKSWAPQKEVLSHDSIGGFVTHCGRSSLLEAVWFGVPMIGWPIYAEQRMNRVVMVEDMQIALPLEEAAGGFVTAAELEKRVIELMDSKTGKAVRQRVKELKYSARAAVAENGSSLIDLHKFLQSTTRN